MTAEHPGWDPDRYLAHADERGRPFLDLVARVPVADPHHVVDLGCGAGNLTRLLAQRWPRAHVTGVDASPAMVERARDEAPEVTVELGDLAEWADGDGSHDVVVTNAALQWVPGHLDLLPGLVARVTPGGWFAMQVPGNFDEPSHAIRRELAAEPAYAAHTAAVATPHAHDPATYLRVLADAGCEVDAWETTYLHVLRGEDPVFSWVSGTGARPTLEALPPGLRGEFETELRRRLRAAYPPVELGGDPAVVLPFRRVFAVAHRR